MRINKKKNALLYAERLENHYPEAVCSLEYAKDPWRLLVMSRLSAQCTDARVNVVSKALFEKYPDMTALSEAVLEELEQIVYPCGLYRTKARDIKKLSKELLTDHNGVVPDTMEGLLSLSGVGRKIANLILGDVYGKGGIVADTHCIRISGRLGLTDSTNQVIVERELDKLIPKKLQTDFCHRLVLFGRDVCTARNPHCDSCFLSDCCPKVGVKTSNN